MGSCKVSIFYVESSHLENSSNSLKILPFHEKYFKELLYKISALSKPTEDF